LITALSALLSMIYVNAQGGSAGPSSDPRFVLVKRIG
jgi:hypothetical protein